MLTRRFLSFFGQALNNTSEQSEVSLFCVVMRPIDFSPFGRRPLVHIRYSLRSSKTSLIFTLRNGQDDKFAINVKIGSTAILLPKYSSKLDISRSFVAIFATLFKHLLKTLKHTVYDFLCKKTFCGVDVAGVVRPFFI